MQKISPLLLLTAAIFTAGTSAYAMPQRASTPPDLSFSVFFDPGGATLSKEGREIVAIAAKRFAATHSRYPAARIFVSGETDEQDSASLSIKRANAVGNELARDGIERKFVTVNEQPGVHSEPVRLLEWLDRRVSISIQENPVSGRILG